MNRIFSGVKSFTCKEKKCEFVVGVYHGFEALPEGFKTGITQEFNDIITGVSKEFK